MRKFWTPDEDVNLKEDYRLLSFEDLVAKYKRSKNAIKARASFLNVKKLGVQNLTSEDIVNIYELENKSAAAIAKLAMCSPTSILKILKQNDIYIRKDSVRKYKINEEFFKVIDSEEKAYILGFLYADGCMSKKRNEVKIELAAVDKHILETFKNIIQPTKPLTFRNNQKLRDQGKKSQDQFCFSMESATIKHCLLNIGMVSNKSKVLVFPNINKILYKHFIRGYFDGDGSIFIYKNSNLFKWRFSINSGSKLFLLKIVEYLEDALDIDVPKLSIDKRGPVYEISINRQVDVKACMNLLYKDSLIHLDRKKYKLI